MSSLKEDQKGNNSWKVLQCQLDFSVRDSNHPEMIFPLAFNLSSFSRKFCYVHIVCSVDWKLICRTINFLFHIKIDKSMNVFHFLRKTKTFLSFTWSYTQPPAPHATPTSGKPLWQDSPVASPPNVGLQFEEFFFTWKTWRSPMQPRGPWPKGRLANAWRARVVASNPRPHRSEQVNIQ